MAISGFTGVTDVSMPGYINAWAQDSGYSITAEYAHPSSSTAGFCIKDSDGHILFTNYPGSGSAGYIYYNNGSSTINLNAVGSAGHTNDIYFCDKGFLLKTANSSSSTPALVLFTWNDDGKLIMVGASSNGLSPKCVRYTDSVAQSCTYTANAANATSLCNFVPKGAVGEDSFAQYAYFMPLCQYNVPGILTLNDEQYITNGYWCIKD